MPSTTAAMCSSNCPATRAADARVVGGVAAAIAGVWAGASRRSAPKLANSGVRTEKADDGWLNREPDHFASAEATAAIAPVITPAPVPAATPMAEYQPPVQPAYQAPPPNPAADQWRRQYRRALDSDVIVGAAGQGRGEHQVLETPRLLSPEASGQPDGAAAADLSPLAVAPHPASPYTITAGTVIYATLETGIDSDLPGSVLGRVAQDVKDSVTQTYVLIPQGSKLIGGYDRDRVAPRQDRLFVTWREIVFPDGGEIQLPDLPGADQAGYAGFQDQVNHHYVKVWTPALLMSAISAGMMMSQAPMYADGGGYGGGYYMSPGQMAAMGAGQQLGQAAMGHLGTATAEARPTIRIRPGYDFRVMVTRDLVFSGPYHD